MLPTINNAKDLTKRLAGIGDIVIYLLVALAVIFIVYNIVIYIVKGNDPKVKPEALKNAGWGILGLAIIVSLWGLVNIIISSFNTNNNTPNFPNADFINSNGNLNNNTTDYMSPTSQFIGQ